MVSAGSHGGRRQARIAGSSHVVQAIRPPERGRRWGRWQAAGGEHVSGIRALRRLTDREVEQVRAAELGVLVVTRTNCGRCAVYQADIERLLSQGRLARLPMGKVVLDEPSAPRFVQSNPWLAHVPRLPYTVLYCRGEQVDAFATSRAAHLLAGRRAGDEDGDTGV